MKNIHVLSTDNPSRLRYNLSNNLVLTKEFYRDYGKQVNRNIYITNDEEGDWFIYKNEIIHRDKGDVDSIWIDAIKNGKKIILTTDQDLIKDGVQAIDDGFLEWFVKNPSCQNVEIVRDLFQINQNNPVTRGSTALVEGYKIIIPKEEVIQVKGGDDIVFPSSTIITFHNPKQETLEEAAEKIITDMGWVWENTETSARRVAEYCAKHQQEKIYSEEGINELLDTLLQNNMCSVIGDELIKQFKNK